MQIWHARAVDTSSSHADSKLFANPNTSLSNPYRLNFNSSSYESFPRPPSKAQLFNGLDIKESYSNLTE